MVRNPLSLQLRPLLLGGGFLLLAACSRPTSIPRASAPSVEQTTHDSLSPEALIAPAQERRRLLTDLGVERWHQQGRLGQGVKIAILDSGFRDWRQYLGKGLPHQVKVRSFRKDRNLEARDSQHGILCGEAVHTIAPDAELLFANWEPDSPQAFLEAVRWVKSEGAKVVSCSLIMPSWSDGEGGGEVHRALHPLLGDGDGGRDLVCFASAGNTAQRHWCGVFNPNEGGWHRWRTSATANSLTPWGKERVAVELYGPMQAGYEVFVHRQKTGELVGRSALQLDATRVCGRAVVRFDPEPGASYDVRVRCVETEARLNAEAFHLVVLGGSLEQATSRGSIPFPGDGARVFAIGAVDNQGQRVAYSSCGPNSRLPKPDFVATVPFPSLCRERPFAGTSAAAPQAAGLAALVWSEHPDWTANQVVQSLRDIAVDLGPPGHDYETGYGWVRLPR